MDIPPALDVFAACGKEGRATVYAETCAIHVKHILRQIGEVLETVKYCVDYKIDMYFQKESIHLFDGEKVNGVMAIYISCASICAEKERENISFRLDQGRRLAIEKGVRMGRPRGTRACPLFVFWENYP